MGRYRIARRRAACCAAPLIGLSMAVVPLAAQSRYDVIPHPVRLVPGAGAFTLGPQTRILLSDPESDALRRAVELWVGRVRDASGLPIPIEGSASADERGAILIRVDAAVAGGPEAYTLSVRPESIELAAPSVTGVFRGLQTLRQLAPIELERGDVRSARSGARPAPHLEIPAVTIDDAPRFGYRGMHLDVGRHLFPVAFIKRYLDLMALYKMNRFHWHLTEDQGWRIEIEKYPRLTEVGAWRKETALGKNFDPYGKDESKFVGDGVPYGGFYTQDEVREIVAYAAERHIAVIPEIEMPGHSTAALAAYPELACTEGPFEVGMRWGVYDDVYCPSERTFEFLEDVLTEVMALFPSQYIHIGGDEAPKVRWEESPLAQEVMRREGLETEEELQSWFIARIERFLLANGRRLIGWDEILEGGLAPEATVMSWRGTEGGIEAARQGHDVIMTPYSHVYFDYYQSRDRSREPLAIGGFTPLSKVYEFEPVPPELGPDEAKHILGAQGNVWTEYMKTPEHVEYMVFPRLLALSEVVWSPSETRDWEGFLERLPAHLRRLDALGVNYRPPEELARR